MVLDLALLTARAAAPDLLLALCFAALLALAAAGVLEAGRGR